MKDDIACYAVVYSTANIEFCCEHYVQSGMVNTVGGYTIHYQLRLHP